MYKTFQIAGRRYRLDIKKAAGFALAMTAWIALWGAFFAAVFGRIAGW